MPLKLVKIQALRACFLLEIVIFLGYMTRETKRIIIILIYLAIFGIVSYFIYLAVRPAPTCLDGKKNQNEQGIDCGGPCAACQKEIAAQDIKTEETAFVYGGPGRFDVLAKISNPNNEYGSSNFSYEFILKGAAGEELSRRNGEEFVLPGETKYIIETNLETNGQPQSVEYSIKKTQWQEFINFQKPQLNIYSKRYDLISGGVGFSEAYGLLKNESPFDFNFIKIKVVLRDGFGKPVALNTTDMQTVSSGEQRDFRLLWPASFPGDVQGVEMEAEADVFDSQNFIKKFLPGGKFQELQ
jgi:hypothetical protein